MASEEERARVGPTRAPAPSHPLRASRCPNNYTCDPSLPSQAAATAGIDPNAPTFFDKIVKKEVKANIIYEDDLCMAFRDINPQGPCHFLVIPKDKDGLAGISFMEERHKSLMGHLMWVVAKVAAQEKLDHGYRVVINNGPDGSQSVYHLHIHVIGGRQMTWPPG